MAPAVLTPEPPHTLRDYALIADGERGALVGPRGELAWMCFPRWDSPALFSSLIGGGGVYHVAPVGRYVWGGWYEHGLIWRTRWVTDDDAVVECRHALALPSTRDRAIVLRQIAVREGAARVRVGLDLGGDVSREDDGAWATRDGERRMRWLGAGRAEADEDRGLVLTLDLEEGDEHDLVLVCDATADGGPMPDAGRAWTATEAAWRERIPPLERAIARRDARHAYAVLSGLTSEGGGMVAAATMSLPERAREGRSYDYRYVWIRDQCYTGRAVAKDGPHPLLDDAVRFVVARLNEDGPQLMPAYTVAGERVPDERRLDLPGYPGGTDIAGNWVNSQFQLDAFGESLLLLATAAEHDHLDADGWRAAEVAVEAIEARWRERDAGIWELEPDAWTHSRLICAAGLRAIGAQQPSERAAHWSALADAIVADTASRALHPTGRWQRSPGDERPDAALLLPALRGALPASDPRSVATVQAVDAELTEDGYCYRYRPDGRPLGYAEGAFLLCGFILALAWAQQGDAVRAARWFERNRSGCGPAGLFSEEFDVRQRQLRGNLPQAFVHALALECALTLPGS